jgi:hypothetical protein
LWLTQPKNRVVGFLGFQSINRNALPGRKTWRHCMREQKQWPEAKMAHTMRFIPGRSCCVESQRSISATRNRRWNCKGDRRHFAKMQEFCQSLPNEGMSDHPGSENSFHRLPPSNVLREMRNGSLRHFHSVSFPRKWLTNTSGNIGDQMHSAIRA